MVVFLFWPFGFFHKDESDKRVTQTKNARFKDTAAAGGEGNIKHY
jgi:hypothetical protein